MDKKLPNPEEKLVNIEVDPRTSEKIILACEIIIRTVRRFNNPENPIFNRIYRQPVLEIRKDANRFKSYNYYNQVICEASRLADIFEINSEFLLEKPIVEQMVLDSKFWFSSIFKFVNKNLINFLLFQIINIGQMFNSIKRDQISSNLDLSYF